MGPFFSLLLFLFLLFFLRFFLFFMPSPTPFVRRGTGAVGSSQRADALQPAPRVPARGSLGPRSRVPDAAPEA